MPAEEPFKDPFEEQLSAFSSDDMNVEDVDAEGLWKGIDHRLPRKSRRPFLYAAASILLLIAFGIALWPEPTINDPVEVSTISKLSDVSPELADQEQAYLQLIDEKWGEVTPSSIDSGTLQFIYDELEMLDELGTEYENELREIGPNEKIIQTILKCYERRLQLLDILKRESEKPKKPIHNEGIFNQEIS